MFRFLTIVFFLFLGILFLLSLFVRILFGRLFCFLGKWHSQPKSQITQPFSQKKKKINPDKGEYIEYEEIKRK